jgi:adenylate cyclase
VVESSVVANTFIRAVSDAIVVADATGDVVAWNPAAESMFGYSDLDAIGRSLTFLLSPSDRTDIERLVITDATPTIGETIELTAVRKDGGEFPIELSLGTWVSEGKRFSVGIIRDVTERRRLSKALTESDARVSTILESASDAIVVIDDEGGILEWNPRATDLFGRSAGEMLGQQLDAIIPERFHRAHHAGIARVASGGETHVIGRTVELAALHADGREFPVELSLSTWVTEGARFFTGIIRDISERKRLLDALAESQARVASIVESANDAILSIDRGGRVLQWNPYAEALFGRTADEMLGQQLDVIIPERFRAAHHAGIARVVRGDERHVIGRTVELAALHTDGREFPIELSLAAWESADGPAFTGIIRDISERKLAEEELQRANEALGEKNEMLQGLSEKLAKYLSRPVYDSIFEGRTEVRLQSYRKLLTVFFSDIQGFTELTDRMEAESISEVLNHYLGAMSEIAARYGGTVDKFIGDGIMIFFGDPETQGEQEDALACARMALAMRSKIEELKGDWQRQAGAVELHVRMGINTGYCTVGNFGSPDRLDYTIVGREVNAASRLESSAQPDQIHISHSTYELIKGQIHCSPVGEITVKGLAYPLRTYEVVSLAEPAREGLITTTIEGFRLELDPTRLTAADASAAAAALRAALGALDQRLQVSGE